MKVKIMQASINIPVPTTITVVQLKDAAKQAAIIGVSSLRKAELEDTVMSERTGRKEVYKIQEEKWAEQILAETLEVGVFIMQKPVDLPLPTPMPLVKANPSGKCLPNKELKRMKEEVERQNARINYQNQMAELPIIKRNNQETAGFKGRVKALKHVVNARKEAQSELPYDERDKRFLVWTETDTDFRLAIRRTPARQVVNS
jgi:hypothetical protein